MSERRAQEIAAEALELLAVATVNGGGLGFAGAGFTSVKSDDVPETSSRPRRIGWAKLLARVFGIDITICRKCGGRMRVFEVAIGPGAVIRALHGARAPPRPAPPGQVLLFA